MLPVMAVLAMGIHAGLHAAAPSRTGAGRRGGLAAAPMVPSPLHGVDGRDTPGHDGWLRAWLARSAPMGTRPAMTGEGLEPRTDPLPCGWDYGTGAATGTALTLL